MKIVNETDIKIEITVGNKNEVEPIGVVVLKSKEYTEGDYDVFDIMIIKEKKR